MSTAKWAVVSVLAVTSIYGFAFGCIDAAQDGSCTYVSVASYHPARILGCELYKHRWLRK